MDSHSAGVSADLLHRGHGVEASTSQLAVMLAFSSNAVVKLVVSCVMGPPSFWQHILGGLAVSVAAGWLGWLIVH
ncbi:MAG: hypothetical protein ABW110_22115 [Steroidobacteraceae bacterium]